MKTTFQTIRSTMQDYRKTTGTIALSFIFLPTLAFATASVVSAQSFTPITSQMDPGSRGAEVTNLQTFIAANPAIYPSGLVTGYYGNLTRSAVKTFQGQYGLDQVGRVGPQTITKINGIIAAGGWNGNTPISVETSPSFYNVALGTGATYLTFTFNTDRATMARVVYNTSPVMFNEGDIHSNGFGAIGGFAVNSNSDMSTSHSITVPNLSSNTYYYYTVIITDTAGNVSVWGPNTLVKTN